MGGFGRGGTTRSNCSGTGGGGRSDDFRTRVRGGVGQERSGAATRPVPAHGGGGGALHRTVAPINSWPLSPCLCVTVTPPTRRPLPPPPPHTYRASARSHTIVTCRPMHQRRAAVTNAVFIRRVDCCVVLYGADRPISRFFTGCSVRISRSVTEK